MNPYHPPNPYAPPQAAVPVPNDSDAAGDALRPAGSGALWVKWVLLPAYVLAVPCITIGWPGSETTPVDSAPPLLFLFGLLCLTVYAVFIFVWIRQSWSMLPVPARRTATGKAITPGAAVARLFIPFYNYYWVFVQSVGLCDALNRQLVALGVAKRAPRGLAIAASIFQLIPYVNLGLGPVFWLLYIFLVDAAKAEYRNRTAS
jgi:hypothetical protein